MSVEIVKKLLHKFRIYDVLVQVKSSFIEGERSRHVSRNELKMLKDSKKGRRCFIVGNGPSLKIEDLDKLVYEDTFAVNRIYKIFNQTQWRPTFYFSQDTRILDEISGDIEKISRESEGIFLNSYVYSKLKKNVRKQKNVYFFYINYSDPFPDLPNFSEEISEQFYEGFTVAYACIQMAVYMGYSEIYIIGTDHSYNMNRINTGEVIKKDGVQNYMPGLEGKLVYPPQMEKSTLAFRKARQCCDEKGIVIKNATRGGMLEEFERVDFDTLL